MDLADLTRKSAILKQLRSESIDHVIYMNCKGSVVHGTSYHQVCILNCHFSF